MDGSTKTKILLGVENQMNKHEPTTTVVASDTKPKAGSAAILNSIQLMINEGNTHSKTQPFEKFLPHWGSYILCASVVAVVVLSNGCMTFPSAPEYTETSVKQLESRPQLSYSYAKAALLEVLQKARAAQGVPLTSIEISVNGFSFTTAPRTYSFHFADLGTLGWKNFRAAYNNAMIWEVRLPGPTYLHWVESVDAARFVDIIGVLRYYSSRQSALIENDATAFSDFQQKAEAWRALLQKPALPEEARRFDVLAKDAIRNRDFEKAVDYYEQGLTFQPLWPEGQYNAAVICGELEAYAQALYHMKRYLVLDPYAKDAQAARNQMYIWEEKVKGK